MNSYGDCDRLTPRHAVLLQARCRKSSWNVFPVELSNISEGGCCIVGSPGDFAAGETVQLRIAHLKAIDARVRWVREGRVGVEFRVALKHRVVGELGGIYGIVVGKGMPAPSEG